MTGLPPIGLPDGRKDWFGAAGSLS